jgi:uncharacterized protein YecE (DUF72 family)
MPASVYVGTSSWVERGLIDSGRFYPAELKDTSERLAFFAQRFNFAEIDSTYYALPSRKNIERWANAVPDGFRFNVKVFALFSQHPTPLRSIPKSFHEALPEKLMKKSRVYEKDIPPEVVDELWTIFGRALGPMRDVGKLGAILLDLPPWYVPSQANRDCISRARERLPKDHVLVEFRNKLWVGDDKTSASTFAMLRDLRAGFMCVDEPQGLTSSFPPAVEVTSGVAGVRFRGRNAERWEDKGASTEEKYNWLYSDVELQAWLPRLEQLRADATDVYLCFNTKQEDQGVVNAAKLKAMLAL